MSSRAFRSVIKRREHLERHQPEARARFGLLEKHKDYVARARNFHSKEARLKSLRVKAANRNPDEFYHKMLSSKTKGGVYEGASEGGRLGPDMLALLQTQDRGYVSTVKAAEDRRIERLQSSLHVLPMVHSSSSSSQPNRHTVFVDSAEEAAAFDAAAFLDTDPALLGRTFNRPRKAQLSGGGLLGGAAAAAAAAGSGASAGAAGAAEKAERRSLKRSRKEKDRAYAELDERMERSEKLGKLAQHMDLKRALQQKGKRVKVKDAEGDAPALFKWKSERKR